MTIGIRQRALMHGLFALLLSLCIVDASDFEDAVAKSKSQALVEFPALAVESSDLSTAVRERTAELRQQDAQSLKTNSDWPLRLARDCAAQLASASAGSSVYDWPLVFTAKTKRSGAGDIKIDQGDTETVIGVGRKAVTVELRFVQKPSAAYTLECFFFAMDAGTKQRFIFDVSTITSSEQYGEFQLISVPLRGNTVSKISNTRIISDGAQSTTVTTRRENTVTGDEISGWIVRLRIGQKLINHKASSHPLSEYAQSNEQLLDKVFEEMVINGAKAGAPGSTVAAGNSPLIRPNSVWLWKSGGELAFYSHGRARHTEWPRDGEWQINADNSVTLTHPNGLTFLISFIDDENATVVAATGGQTTISLKK